MGCKRPLDKGYTESKPFDEFYQMRGTKTRKNNMFVLFCHLLNKHVKTTSQTKHVGHFQKNVLFRTHVNKNTSQNEHDGNYKNHFHRKCQGKS